MKYSATRTNAERKRASDRAEPTKRDVALAPISIDHAIVVVAENLARIQIHGIQWNRDDLKLAGGDVALVVALGKGRRYIPMRHTLAYIVQTGPNEISSNCIMKRKIFLA